MKKSASPLQTSGIQRNPKNLRKNSPNPNPNIEVIPSRSSKKTTQDTYYPKDFPILLPFLGFQLPNKFSSAHVIKPVDGAQVSTPTGFGDLELGVGLAKATQWKEGPE